MTLKSFIAEKLDPRAFRARPIPQRSRMAIVAEKIAAQEGHVQSLDREDLSSLIELLESCTSGREWRFLTGRQIRQAPMALWHGEPPLVSRAGLLEAYLAALTDLNSRLATRSLIWAYLMHFNHAASATRDVGRHLARECGRWKWEWSDRHTEFGLFDPAVGPRRIALHALDADDARRAIEKVGLRGALAISGFAYACFAEAARETQNRLERAPAQEAVQRLSSLISGGVGRPPLSRARPLFATALLQPWSSGDPPDAIRSSIRGEILDSLGDPRRNPAEWVAVPDDAKRIMYRWLARASLEQFLIVVDRTALDQKQWEARRAFWGAYIDGHHVADAWVAFASTGAFRARQIADKTNDTGMLSFGALKGGGTLSDHAVLLLKIGSLVVADWSHNGSLRIWHERSQAAPVFYREEYKAESLRAAPDFDKRHLGDWQRDARQFIWQHTGIRPTGANRRNWR